MAITQSSVVDLYDPAVRTIVFRAFDKWEPLAAKVFEMAKSDRKTEIMAQMSGVGYLPVKNAGAAYAEEEPQEGFKLSVTHNEYGLATQLTESALEDDQFGILKQTGQSLLRSGQHTIENVCWGVLNNGFTATAAFGATGFGDGLALYNTAKLRLGVGAPSFANKSATDVALSVAALKTACDLLRAQADMNNLPHFVEPPFYLIVHPNNAQTAFELVKSELKAGTGNNDINFFAQQGLIQVVVVPYLTSATNWHLWAKNHGQKCFMRVRPEIRTLIAQNTGNLVYQARMRISASSAHQLGIYGSNA